MSKNFRQNSKQNPDPWSALDEETRHPRRNRRGGGRDNRRGGRDNRRGRSRHRSHRSQQYSSQQGYHHHHSPSQAQYYHPPTSSSSLQDDRPVFSYASQNYGSHQYSQSPHPYRYSQSRNTRYREKPGRKNNSNVINRNQQPKVQVVKPLFKPEHTRTSGIVISHSEQKYGFIKPIGFDTDVWFGSRYSPPGTYYPGQVVNFKVRFDANRGKQECYELQTGPHFIRPVGEVENPGFIQPPTIDIRMIGNNGKKRSTKSERSSSTRTPTARAARGRKPIGGFGQKKRGPGPVLVSLKKSKEDNEEKEREEKDPGSASPSFMLFGTFPEDFGPEWDMGEDLDDVDPETGMSDWVKAANNGSDYLDKIEAQLREAVHQSCEDAYTAERKKFVPKFEKLPPKNDDEQETKDNKEDRGKWFDDIMGTEGLKDIEIKVADTKELPPMPKEVPSMTELPPMPSQSSVIKEEDLYQDDDDEEETDSAYTRNGVDKSTIACRYHGSARGCAKGDECPYSHDDPNAVRLCEEWHNNGHCSYEDECRFRHEYATPGEIPKSKKDTRKGGMRNAVNTTTTTNGEQPTTESLKTGAESEKDAENLFPEGLDATSVTTHTTVTSSVGVEEKEDSVVASTAVSSKSFNFAEQEIQRMAFEGASPTFAQSWRAESLSPRPVGRKVIPSASSRGITKYDLRGWYSSDSSASRAH